ncbi:flagellar hook-length control protein FliK [Salinisphaera hydrothermalis]|uniref:flagellar hook-length control protein FliK n=1 Tax=Salinisphaera hydrothermalis TaxID=563188 RepID=UPI00333E23EA
MTIDLGALSAGAAKTAAPKNTTTPKASNNNTSDFSRTLAASQASRDSRSGQASSSNGQQQTSGSQAPAQDASSRQASHVAQADHSSDGHSADAQSKPASADPKTAAAEDHQNTDVVRRRLSTESKLASRAETDKNAADRVIAETSARDARNVADSANRAAAEAATQTQTAAQGTAARSGSATTHPHKIASSNKTTTDKTHDTQSQKGADAADSTGPIAALVQAPLIVTQTIKPGNGSQTGVSDATHGHSHSAAASLRASWQQLFTQLGGRGGQGSSNGDASGQTRGDNPAQLLAALTTDGKNSPDARSGQRFSLTQTTDSSASATNGSALTAATASALHSTSATHGQAASAPATASTQTTLSAPLASSDWNQALGQHTMRLVGSGQQLAQIQLHPRELGQINISVTVNDHNQAQIHFAAAHAHVRDAVEAALPQLRQSLAAGGLSLGQASVGDQNSQAAFAGRDDQSGQRSGRPSAEIAAVTETSLDDTSAVSPVSRRAGPISGIDIFA